VAKGSEKMPDQKIEMVKKHLGQEVPVHVGKQKYMILSLGTFVGVSCGRGHREEKMRTGVQTAVPG